MTKRTGQRYFTSALMLALGFFLLLPLATTANAQNRRERREDRRERREDRRERRDARRDVDGDGDFDQRDRVIRQQQRSNGNAYGRYRDPRDRDGDGDYDQRDVYIIQQQQRNSGYGNYGGYGNNGGYRNNRGYGNYGYGNYNQSQQTALNAGYNEGIKEGRKDRGRGGYRNVNDFSAYRNADKDYNSRYGDRYQYQQYFRQGFVNGYNDGVQGY